MTANVAGIALSVEGGADLADKINPRLVELSLTESREEEADELSLRLQNADGALAVPEPGRVLVLALGWLRGSGVPVGLVDKGRFTVDELGEEGAPDCVVIRARSADLTGLYRQRRTKSWSDTTLGSILRQIANRHGGFARVESGLADRPVAAIEQEGKSDMAFVRDLGRRYDAIATWKDGVLLFLPIGASATASGAPLDSHTLTRQSGSRWRFARTERENYDGAEAQWQDSDAGRRRTVGVGGENRRKLKRIYASEGEARQAARAAMSRDARTPYSFTYELAVADCNLQPDQRVSLQGWSPTIDGIDWLVKSVETTLSAGGLSQRIELENA